jgi:centrosomal CEP192-like protein
VELLVAARKLRRELIACCLVAVFAAGAMAQAQSLGDLGREQRQKKASAAQSGATGPKVFSNEDNPPPQAATADRRPAAKTNAGGQTLLKIVSPADGTVVSPGETISVTVTSTSGASLSNVGLLGENPLGIYGPASSFPARFSVTIPRDISSRRYTLTAVANNAAGELVESDAIEIDVERPEMPVSLSEVNSGESVSMVADTQGETHRFLMLAHFADGSVVDVSGSPRLSFQSMDTSIVSVDETGTAMALAAGHAEIIVSYSNPNGQALRRRIPVTVGPFRVAFAPSSLDFGEVPVGSSAKLALTVTNNSISDNHLTFKAVTANGAYTEKDNCISSSPLTVGATCEITVTFTPSAVGRNQGTLSVIDSFNGVASVILLSGAGKSN